MEVSVVSKMLLAVIAVVASLTLLGFSQRAEAGMPVASLPHDQAKVDVRWKCGLWRCFWTPGYVGVIPGYAVAWGPPRAPGCFWRRTVWGGWVHICP
jgi:hypothetical protein